MDCEVDGLTGDMRLQYLQGCVRLAQENKITIKNSFDIKLIDHLISLSKESGSERQETNFPLASMSLHASGKLYGYRVDSVHLDTCRLVLELPKRKKRGAAETDGSEFGFPESQKVKRRRVLSSYLAREGEIDRPIEIDHDLGRPLMMETVNVNFGNALGFLISHNLIPPENHGIDVEGISPWWSGERLKKVVTKDRLIRIRKDLPLLVEVVELNFDFRQTLDVKSEDASPIRAESQAFDPDAYPEPAFEHIAPLDIDEYDIDDSSPDTLGNIRLDIPGDLSQIYSNSFSSSGMNFAGPSVFRLKRFDILGAEKKSERSTGRSKRQELKYLSLKTLPAGLENCEPDHKIWTELSQGTMDRWTDELTTAEVDFAPSSFARLAELFAFPNRRIPEDQEDGPVDDTEQPMTSNDFDDFTSADDVNDSGLGQDRFGISVSDEADTEFEIPMSQPVEDLRYDNLISAPGILAEMIEVTHSKLARKLDVRQMTKSFWKVLTNDTVPEVMTGVHSFRDLYREATKHLTEMNKINMNLPIAFVATLSLCNTKHLVLSQEGDCANFLISQARTPSESEETGAS